MRLAHGWWMATALVVVITASCATATSLSVEVFTDVPCVPVQPTASLVVAGSLAELPASVPASSSTRCEADGHLGQVVIAPGGAKDATIALAVMVRPDGQSGDTCLDPKNAPGCIVAKRRVRFEKRTEMSMRVDLRLSCLGVVCGENETCVRGTCVAADVACGASCDEETLLAQNPRSSADAGTIPAEIDGGVSSGVDAASDGAVITPTSVPLADNGPFATSDTALAAGIDHACVLYASGQIGCWGANNRGQLGDGTTTARAQRTFAVAGISNAVAVVSGNHWSCALLADGRVACWGANDLGQLGDLSDVPFATTPRFVSGLTGITALAAGESHACAVSGAAPGTETLVAARCWGANDRGQLGIAPSPSSRVPVRTDLDATATDNTPPVVGAGRGHSCAGANGNLYCWGENGSGQLGNNALLSRHQPAGVQFPSPITLHRAALGAASSCVIAFDPNGTRLYCWGANESGQLGLGSASASPTLLPTGLSTIFKGTFGDDGGMVFRAHTATALTAGESHVCQRSQLDAVLCWGRNDVGQLGPGIAGNRSSQTEMSGVSNVIAISARGSSTCVLTSSGIACYGALGSP